jgi:hypothetical protein
MTNPAGSSNPSILEILRRLFAKPKPAAPGRITPPDNITEPMRMTTARVLLVIYDPVMDAASGSRLSRFMHWQNPDDLVNAYIRDILEASGGMARYQVVQRFELDEFPAKTDGYRYDPQTYLDVLRGVQPPHQPEGVDYQAILNGLQVQVRLAKREIDEVWLFGFPQAGFYESVMGGAGAFWCNSEPLALSTSSSRRFVVMGFSYERGVGEMLEAFGHRAESLVARVFHCQDFVAWAYRPGRAPAVAGENLNLFQQFLCFDQIAPGRAGVGSIHYAPNSERDYDWNNPRYVPSTCHDWLRFPAFQHDVHQVNAMEWGNGDIRAHHRWWLGHLPKVAGRTGGVVNNWWQYILNPNLIAV